MSANHLVTTDAELDALYGEPMRVAILKELDHISDHYRTFIDKSPFAVVATVGQEGLDCSPRGDPTGFVRVVDRNTVMLPDRRGNNRIDSLRNLVRDPRISLLFLIPGIGQTLRINGRAVISADPELCASFKMQGKAPRSVIVVTVQSVYFQCPKALIRSRLWDSTAHVAQSELPTAGEIAAALTNGEIDAKQHDATAPARIKETIY